MPCPVCDVGIPRVRIVHEREVGTAGVGHLWHVEGRKRPLRRCRCPHNKSRTAVRLDDGLVAGQAVRPEDIEPRFRVAQHGRPKDNAVVGKPRGRRGTAEGVALHQRPVGEVVGSVHHNGLPVARAFEPTVPGQTPPRERPPRSARSRNPSPPPRGCPRFARRR